MKKYVEVGDIWHWKCADQDEYLLVMDWDIYDDAWQCLRMKSGIIDNWLMEVDDPVGLEYWEYVA